MDLQVDLKNTVCISVVIYPTIHLSPALFTVKAEAVKCFNQLTDYN